jgi:hypothetical protein
MDDEIKRKDIYSVATDMFLKRLLDREIGYYDVQNIVLTGKQLEAFEKQARADEREKCNWAHNDAYAKGKREGEQSKTAFKMGVAEGQAELIEKGWKILQSYNNTALWHSKHFLLMLIKASESLSDASTSVKSETTVGDKTKPEKPCLDWMNKPSINNAKTKRKVKQ